MSAGMTANWRGYKHLPPMPTEVFADPGRHDWYFREKQPDSVARFIRADLVQAKDARIAELESIIRAKDYDYDRCWENCNELRDKLARLLADTDIPCAALESRDAQMRPEGRVAGLREGYLLGFMASGEGYNAEYPFGDKGIDPESDDEWCKARDEAIKNEGKGDS